MKYQLPVDHGKNFLDYPSILERKNRLVAIILCFYRKSGLKEHHRIGKMTEDPGFRLSEV